MNHTSYISRTTLDEASLLADRKDNIVKRKLIFIHFISLKIQRESIIFIKLKQTLVKVIIIICLVFDNNKRTSLSMFYTPMFMIKL